MGHTLITPNGPASASVMIVLDSGTLEDAKAGKAFSGNYSKDVKVLCNESGLLYDSTYKTLYLKEKLSYNGKNKKLKIQSIHQAKANFNYDELLVNEIQALRPTVIIPMGELVFNFLCGQHGLSKFRGSVLPLKKELDFLNRDNKYIKVIPTLGPEYFNAKHIYKLMARHDFAKAAKRKDDYAPFIDETIVWVADTVEKFQNFLNRFQGADIGVFDIETQFNIPICIGFCFDGKEGVCVPLVDKNVDPTQLAFLWKLVDQTIRTFLSKGWLNQNIKFDLLVLERYGFKIDRVVGDTALRASTIYPELPKKLGFLNSIYTDMPYFKDEGKDSKDRTQLYLYCAKDCVSTYQIFKKQDTELSDLKLESFNAQVHSLFWPYIRMERRGLLIDEEKRRQLFAKYSITYEITRRTLSHLTNLNVNPHSWQQVAALVYGEFSYPIRKDRITGALKTDEETLEELMTFHSEGKGLGKIVLELIIGSRKLHKVIEYIETPIHPDSRFRSSFDLGGTKTGRSSGKSTTDYLLTKDDQGKWITTECGRSLQTIGKHGFKIGGVTYGHDLRSMFVPTPGYIFVNGDLSQAEARVDAVLAKDYNFLAKFDVPPGIHALTGSWIFGLDPWEVKKDPEKYFIGKTVRHAAERAMGPDRLGMMVQKPLAFCKEVLEKFHRSQPNIRAIFHKEVVEYTKRHRNLVSYSGRRRDFFGRPDHEMEMECISQLPQSVVSDQTKFSLPLLEARFAELDFDVFFLGEFHDALLAEIHKDDLEVYAKEFKRIVERPIDCRIGSLPRDFDLIIPSELEWSAENWEALKKYEN